ncbi:extracellular solute-binding protein [Candidatus Woesebacteria bacterium]|nr:extracellular solute-binding protein [Candidatus Woesebacteria bacterium]
MTDQPAISEDNKATMQKKDNVNESVKIKSGDLFSNFTLLNFLRPKSATKIPKEVTGKIQKPVIKNPAISKKPFTKSSISKKKIFIIILLFLFLIILLLLVAVAIRNKPEKTVGERGKITWWGQRDANLVQPLIDKFEEENPGVNVVYQKQEPIDYRIRLQNLIKKGQAPDIFTLHNTWAPMFRENLDVLPPSVMEKDRYNSIFYPAIISSLTSSKGIVGVPLGYDALVLYISQDLFSTAFAQPPQTWDDFWQLADHLKDVYNDRIIQAGAAMGLTGNVEHWQEIIALLMIQNEVNLYQPAGQRAQAVLDYYTSFTGKKAKIWDETLPESVIAFANKKVAMILAPTYRANDIRKINPDLRFYTVPVPQIPQDQPENPDITYATFWFEGVWNRSVNNDIAWELLNFLTERDNLVELSNNYQANGLIPEAFPRKDMRVLIKDNSILGSAVNLADHSVSWFLADDTSDGEGGINSQLSSVFASGVTESLRGNKKSAEIVSGQLPSVLSKYGLVSSQTR